jgi:hypothetical protein
MKAKYLPFLALGALVACGGSYSNPEPDPTYGNEGVVVTDNGDDDDDDAVRANSASMDRVVRVAREVLAEEGWTVYRVDRSGTDRVIEARRSGDERLRIYATPRDGDIALRGWHQEAGDLKGSPQEILAAIELRLRTGND